MKKLIGLLMLLFALTGCSVEIDGTSVIDSKSEKLEAKAEDLQYAFDNAVDKLKPLEGKNKLSRNDQKLISKEIDQVTAVIDEFKETEMPVVGKKVKELADSNLNERHDRLKDVQKKAESNTATKADVKAATKAMYDDINISLFN
ncbi:hypothetical protein [Bacillus sp. T33-2]|uniref:hypothetical protein n=1 Tax=Bacillus sp. T33-2 TaxID=2054168 RepID=UPI000C78B8F6|nr:hypothetical protein [Bacillus sp. T33-2]PLR96758.1 hypothetical protein CVD19_10295 [Bacillus sp. T33-2]